VNNEEGKKPQKGLGDLVSKAINTVTFGKIKECEPCKKRKELLNKIKIGKRSSK